MLLVLKVPCVRFEVKISIKRAMRRNKGDDVIKNMASYSAAEIST